MTTAAGNAPAPRWRPRRRLWALLTWLTGASIALSAIAQWRDDHTLLVNSSDSLPNWAFVVHRGATPAKGDYVFFDPPPSALLRRHFGAKPQLFGKIVYGVPGDRVAHRDRRVIINGHLVGTTKPRTKTGEPLAIGPTGVIPPSCYYVGTPHPDGFDSRYAAIGFVCRHRIVGTGEPIL